MTSSRPDLLSPQVKAPIVGLDTPLDACINGELTKHLGQGWSSPEDWGCWSDAPEAAFSLTVQTEERSDLIADFRLRGYVSERTPEQRVQVLVNGVERAIWVFTSGDSSRKNVGIPAIGRHFGTRSCNLNFRFLIASPESPAETSTADDPRKLGLGLESLCLTKAAEPVLNQSLGYDLPLDACEGGALSSCLSSGWSRPEEWGCWSVAQLAILHIPLTVPARRELFAEFRVRGYVSEKTPEQRVAVFVNGQMIALWRLSSPDLIIQNLSFSLLNGANILDFAFMVESPESPAQTGAGSDLRQLGLGLMSLRISMPATP